jgi:hypothetical protein
VIWWESKETIPETLTILVVVVVVVVAVCTRMMQLL